jgi:hypothetical protein
MPDHAHVPIHVVKLLFGCGAEMILSGGSMGAFHLWLVVGKRERGRRLGRVGNQESEAGWENLQIAKEVLGFSGNL